MNYDIIKQRKYKRIKFNQVNKIVDFGRSYSFENSNNSKTIKTPAPENYFANSYNNYMTIPASIEEKENLKQNIEVERYRHKSHAKESVLMQKVNRILEKRSKFGKHKSKNYKKKSIDRIRNSKNSTFKSLKHCKNEIISRINKS